MSEEQNAQLEQAAPAVEEQDATSESAQDAGELIADAKKYRKRAQQSETRTAELEGKLKQMEETTLSENEEWKTLAEKRGAELAELKEYADRGKALEDVMRSEAMDSLSEEDREFAEDLSTEKLLKFAKRVAPIDKVATNESAASPVAQMSKDSWEMSPEERRKHWSSIVQKYQAKS
tara:strand:+ start:1537 stop:2067 length:531 start_codon:yes stop_codon:yes gene_type:complete